MSKAKYILRFKGKGPIPTDDLERIRAQENVKVLDDSSPRMVLVEAPEQAAQELDTSMPEWVVSPERKIQMPDTRLKPERNPEKE